MSVGAHLQQIRKERKLSLAEVTEQIKIQPWVLEALEADRLTGMMSPIYVKGFLSSYARYLHLDAEALIAQLHWPEQAAPAETQAEPLPPPAPLPEPIEVPWPLLRRLGAALALGLAVAGVVAVNPLQWLPKLPSPGEAARKVASVMPAKTNELQKPAAAPTLALLPTQPLELLVSAQRTTWIQVRADGRLVSQQRLPRGANERWVAKKRLELIVAKPSQVELMLNGQAIGPLAMAHHGRLLITHYGVTRLPDEP